MSKDWKKELEEYIARATKKQHVSDKLIIALASTEHSAKISVANKGKKKAPRTKDHLNKISNANTGKPLSEDHKARISAGRKGVKNSPRSESHSAKLSAANKGKPSPKKGVPKLKVICPHCGKEGGTNLMKRWHFDNCKLKRD
jgi:hypothetical protein